MKEKFFGENLFLHSESAKEIYKAVKDLPIVDYHCHLDPRMIAENVSFSNIGALWLAGDHYKWRAMRLYGVDEYYITGKASDREKFRKYAEVVPSLIGNPLYYWTHMELSQIFDIHLPLNRETADEIFDLAGEKLKNMRVQDLLSHFGVTYIATTDDPVDDLRYHGVYGKTTVAPTFRPDKVFTLDETYLETLGKVAETDVSTLQGLLSALTKRLDYFVSKGCRITDHGFERFPSRYLGVAEAEEAYLRRATLTPEEKEGLFGFLLTFLMREYKQRDLTVQLHFGVTRNVNPETFRAIGVDSGFDVMSDPPSPKALISFLSRISDEERPRILLYTLNDAGLSSLATVSGAFRNVRMGAAWWFNDNVSGIRKNLLTVSEYALLGNSTGMLTDSRSFSSYARFDFFRRLLADFIGEYVENGEYDADSAASLAEKICYTNAKEMIDL